MIAYSNKQYQVIYYALFSIIELGNFIEILVDKIKKRHRLNSITVMKRLLNG